MDQSLYDYAQIEEEPYEDKDSDVTLDLCSVFWLVEHQWCLTDF